MNGNPQEPPRPRNAAEDRARRALSAFGTAATRFAGRAGTDGPGAAGMAITGPIRAQLALPDFPPELVDLAWTLVADAEHLDTADQRALLLLVLAALASVRQGSTRLSVAPGSAALGRLVSALAGGGDVSADLDRIEALLAPGVVPGIIGGPEDYRPLVRTGDHVYLQRLHREEDRLVAALAQRIAPVARLEEGSAALADVLARPVVGSRGPVEISTEQQAAVMRAVQHRLSVTSGGPGTGKTSIILAMLRVLVRLGEAPETIALAAPTGKAAKRMAEAVSRGLGQIADPGPEDRALIDARIAPQTIHRLLGYLPGLDTFAHHENSPLSARTLIVDESSMIDLTLMARLVRAVHPDARLALLGDAHQLPSVEAGAVLRDVAAGAGPDRPGPDRAGPDRPGPDRAGPDRPGSDRAGPDRPSTAPRARAPGLSFATTLRQSFRMDERDPAGRNLFQVACRVHAGDDRGLFDPEPAGGSGEQIILRSRVSDLSFSRVEMLDAGDEPRAAAALRAEFLRHWYQRRVMALSASPTPPTGGTMGGDDLERLRERVYRARAGAIVPEDTAAAQRLLAHFEGHKVLSVTRGPELPTGSAAINRALHELAEREARFSIRDRRGPFLPGEPVIVERNDYERRLFNGDQGVVLAVSEDHGPPVPMAVFPQDGGLVAFHLETLRDQLSLAYALTVHKAQGSEHTHVALILPERDLPILSREILYTALTRSTRSVIVVGPRRIFSLAVARRLERDSGVAEKLARALPG